LKNDGATTTFLFGKAYEKRGCVKLPGSNLLVDAIPGNLLYVHHFYGFFRIGAVRLFPASCIQADFIKSFVSTFIGSPRYPIPFPCEHNLLTSSQHPKKN